MDRARALHKNPLGNLRNRTATPLKTASGRMLQCWIPRGGTLIPENRAREAWQPRFVSWHQELHNMGSRSLHMAAGLED